MISVLKLFKIQVDMYITKQMKHAREPKPKPLQQYNLIHL